MRFPVVVSLLASRPRSLAGLLGRDSEAVVGWSRRVPTLAGVGASRCGRLRVVWFADGWLSRTEPDSRRKTHEVGRRPTNVGNP